MKLTLLDVKGEPFGTVELPEDSLRAFLKESLPMPAQLKDSDEVGKLNEKIDELSDPAKLREKLMEIASTWTEDEYRELGESLGFATARSLTAQEEAELAQSEPATVDPKVFLKVGKSDFSFHYVPSVISS
jgi:hypothetical protein